MAMNIPGFTAEASAGPSAVPYASASVRGGRGGVVPQARAGWPFSGSCGCWPGVCCCELCYFTSCYFWCWSTVYERL